MYASDGFFLFGTRRDTDADDDAEAEEDFTYEKLRFENKDRVSNFPVIELEGAEGVKFGLCQLLQLFKDVASDELRDIFGEPEDPAIWQYTGGELTSSAD
ncbi:hypothetical protein HDU83_005870 [Entophlyctis luteolus]|nr:hypothetical protein HDU83_005870 [Entophlyctis luteolus]